MLKTLTLESGLKVATYNLPNLRSIHLLAAVKGGSLSEDKNKNGLAHLLEHMLVQGIPSYPTAEEFSFFIESLAGTYGAYTQQLLLGFEITLPSSELQTAIKITSEVLFQPLFREDAFKKEKRIVISEIKQRMDSQWFKINQFFQKARFVKGHILTQNPGGTVAQIEKLKKESLLSFWERYFVPKNTYLLVVGNFSYEKLLDFLQQYFSQYQSKEEFPGYPKMSEDDFSPLPVSLRYDPVLQTDYLDLTFPSLKLSDSLDLRMKQSLALTVLGKLRNSRLFKLLRYQKGLVYDVRAQATLLPDLGYIHITSEAPTENLEEVVKLIIFELANFTKSGPTEEELRFAKNFLTNQWQMAFDHPSSIAGWLEGELLWEKEIALPEELTGKLSDFKISDIVEVMQKYWHFDKLQLVIQGPIRKTQYSLAKYEKIIKEVKG